MSFRPLLCFLTTALFPMLAFPSGIPVILNHSDCAMAGDVIYLQGSDFGPTPFVEYSFNDGNWKNLPVLEAANGVIHVRVPKAETGLPDLITIRASADNGTWSSAVYVNNPRIFSMDTDEVSPGGSFRIFGKSLLFDRLPSVRFLDLSTGTQLLATVNRSSSTSYALQVTAPNDLIPTHRYKVSVSNGYSGNSSTGLYTIAEQQLFGRIRGVDYWNLEVPWAVDLDYYSNVYNIQSDPRLTVHSSGSGAGDDTSALNEAIYMAGQSGGGIVFLPAGTYNLHYYLGCGIALGKRVAVVGAGKDLTTINYGFGVAPGSGTGYGACFSSQSGLSDLTMNNVNESGSWPESALSSNATELFLQRIAWNIGTSQWLSLTSINRLAIENSTITQGIDEQFNFNGVLNLAGCSWCRISGNAINFAVGGMLFDSMRNSVFENNVVTRNISVAPDPRSVTHSIAASFATDLVIINNRFTSEGGASPTNNDGEVINSEAGGPNPVDQFRGIVSASSPLTLSDNNQNFSQSTNSPSSLRAGTAVVAIVSGDGMGQYRTVTAVSPDFQTVTIDRPWDVLPQSGDHYSTFDWSAKQWIIADNVLLNNFKGIEFFNASSTDILIQSNVQTDSSGIMITPTQQPPGSFSVAWSIDIVSNIISDKAGLRPAYIAIVPREDQQTTSFGTSVLGVQVRSNSITAHLPNYFLNYPAWDDYKATVEGYNCYWQWQTSWSGYDSFHAPPPLLGTIFQYNTATNSSTAIFLNTGAAQTVFSDMHFDNVQNETMDNPIPGAGVGSAGTLIIQDAPTQALNGSTQGASSGSAGDPIAKPLIIHSFRASRFLHTAKSLRSLSKNF